MIEADYVEPDDWTTVGLSGDRDKSIVSLRMNVRTVWSCRVSACNGNVAACHSGIIDTDYSFDLNLRDYPNIRGTADRHCQTMQAG